MKKIIIAMAAIAAAFTMASCNKEQLTEAENNPTEGNCIITASTESNITKTSLYGNDTDGYEVVWSEGDSFKIGEETFTLIEGAGTTSGKFQGTLPEGDGPFTAYYPATYNGTDWPTTQTYTEGNITGSPMTAEVVKGAESLSFKNAGGILRLTLKGTDEIRKITVKADGLDEIALKYDSGVTLNADGIVFHIALPEGEYEGASITIYTKNWDYCTKNLKAGTKLNIVRSEITTASFTVSFPSPTSTDPLTGVFSIADGKQISFSRGNLYYDGSFKFESKQCDFHGYDSSSNTWGLFGWSTSNTNYGMSTSQENNSYSGDFVDWGNAIDSDNTWRTLSKDEWQYLFETRPNADKKYGYGRVYGTYGLIILPDEFTDPMKNGGSGAFVPGMGSMGTNVYTLGGNWEAMESAGAVFLPIAGYRGGSTIYGEKDYGMYWSSSASDTEKAYYLDFNVSGIKPANSDGRRFGLSVRLVTDLYTVTFDMNGKEGTAPESINGIKYGSTITKPSDPTAEGYAFAGWYKDVTCTQAWNFASDKVTSNITLYAKWYELPVAIQGKFTVNDEGKQVYFAAGNLTYDVSTTAWGIYKNQYDCATGFDPNLISLFTWGYDATKSINPSGTAFVETDPKASGTFSKSEDWGYVFGGESSVWRTLSIDEWEYLLNKRTMANVEDRYSLDILYGGKRGMVLYPDDYNGSVLQFGINYTDETFPKDCVFLPVAGARSGTNFVHPDEGNYWTSSFYPDVIGPNSKILYFEWNVAYTTYGADRRFGMSVRLVTDVVE